MSDQASPSPAEPAAGPQGFGGWLILLAIGVCLAPLRSLVELSKSADAYGQFWNVPNGKAVVLTECGISVFLFVLQVVTMVSMLNKFRNFPMLLTWLWVATIVGTIANMVVFASLFPQATGELFGAEFGRTIATVVVTGAWVCYVHLSVRVANTFTK